MKKKNKLLYVYEERIPLGLRKLVKEHIKKHNFLCKEMTYNSSKTRQKYLLSWADAVFFAPGRHIPIDILETGKDNIKIFQLWSSGFEKFNFRAAKKLKIPLANNGSDNGTAVSEMTVLLMLAIYKKLVHFSQRGALGNWKNNSHGLDLFEMSGKTVGIIGFGNIGRRVAKICKSFGMKILYFDKIKQSKKIEKETDATYVTKKILLNKSDIITLHLHYNLQTKNILNKESFKQMKKNPVLINTSRAALVDNKELLKCLKKNKISGAGLDVHDVEPTLKGDLLNNFPTVVATPHIAGSTYDTYVRVINGCLKNIKHTIKNKKDIKWEV